MSTANTSTSSSSKHDPHWSAVDAYALPHSHPSTRPNTAALAHALDTSRAAGLPDISVSAAQAKFMALLCRAQNVTHALELGTLGGYSAIWLASLNPQLRLISIESNAHHVAVARQNLAFAGLADRVDVIHGAGVDVLRTLKEEVDKGARPQFGFVFIDADKENNWNYFDVAADMARPLATICVDNVVRRGRLADLGDRDPMLVGARQVIENAGRDPRVDSVVIQTVDENSYDGCLWAVVN